MVSKGPDVVAVVNECGRHGKSVATATPFCAGAAWWPGDVAVEGSGGAMEPAVHPCAGLVNYGCSTV